MSGHTYDATDGSNGLALCRRVALLCDFSSSRGRFWPIVNAVWLLARACRDFHACQIVVCGLSALGLRSARNSLFIRNVSGRASVVTKSVATLKHEEELLTYRTVVSI